MEKDRKKKKKKICGIMVDVASRGWKKKKVKYGTDGLSNEETSKQKKNKNDEIDNTIMEKNCNCYQLKVFMKKVLVGQKKQKKGEQKQSGKYANRSWVACGRDDICM